MLYAVNVYNNHLLEQSLGNKSITLSKRSCIVKDDRSFGRATTREAI